MLSRLFSMHSRISFLFAKIQMANSCLKCRIKIVVGFNPSSYPKFLSLRLSLFLIDFWSYAMYHFALPLSLLSIQLHYFLQDSFQTLVLSLKTHSKNYFGQGSLLSFHFALQLNCAPSTHSPLTWTSSSHECYCMAIMSLEN